MDVLHAALVHWVVFTAVASLSEQLKQTETPTQGMNVTHILMIVMACLCMWYVYGPVGETVIRGRVRSS